MFSDCDVQATHHARRHVPRAGRGRRLRRARRSAWVGPPVIVVGAGPAGLAAAAALSRRGIPALVLERSDVVGSSWRTHYERLHLHTTRMTSHLPGLLIPRSAGRWVSRADLVRYLERYAVHHRLRIRTGVEVVRIDPAPGGWAVRTAAGEVLNAPRVVVATGYNHTPVQLDLPGADTFTGRLLHAAEYRVPGPFRGQDVLVVGVGNTGAEIAVDLVEGGAARVRLAVRTPPHIVRRSVLGWPAQGTGMLVRHLPDALVDRLAAVQARLTMPDLGALGLPRPAEGLATRVRAGSIPVQDVGLIAAVRAGTVTIVPAVVGFDGDAVLLADGSRVCPDAVVVATGYRTGLAAMVGHLGVLDDQGLPRAHGPRSAASAPGLHLLGYANPISGALREIRLESRRTAARVQAELT
jgi:putative flavoprotein involved in K+ transport